MFPQKGFDPTRKAITMSDWAPREAKIPRREQERRSLALAFERAERQDRELRRLKALYPQWSGLWFGKSSLAESQQLVVAPAGVRDPAETEVA
jgi:hypothetical protein